MGNEQMLRKQVILNHRQHQCGRPEFEIRGELAHIRVTNDHVQPSILLRIAMRFVSRINYWPLHGRFQTN